MRKSLINKKVILWGSGDGGKYAYEHLKDIMDIQAFGDNNVRKIGTEYMGLPILSVEQVHMDYPDAVVLNTIMSVKHDRIKEELRELGLENEIYQYTEFLGEKSVTDRRNECAEFHDNCMENYYEEAEEASSLNIFWGETSPFKKMFDSMDITNVVELACGRGRHVPNYIDQAETIVLVDILEKNIAFCENRFQGDEKIKYYINSGHDLEKIKDDSITAIFSYDAMVHFESIDVYYYLKEAFRILKHGGMALFHHSNNDKDYRTTFLSGECGRNYMSMSLFAHFANRAGFSVVNQVEYPWNERVTDGITLLRKE